MERIAMTAQVSPCGEVRCPNCRLLLARQEGQDQVEVRWKALAVLVKGGTTLIKCRRCGTVCSI